MESREQYAKVSIYIWSNDLLLTPLTVWIVKLPSTICSGAETLKLDKTNVLSYFPLAVNKAGLSCSETWEAPPLGMDLQYTFFL